MYMKKQQNSVFFNNPNDKKFVEKVLRDGIKKTGIQDLLNDRSFLGNQDKLGSWIFSLLLSVQDTKIHQSLLKNQQATVAQLKSANKYLNQRKKFIKEYSSKTHSIQDARYGAIQYNVRKNIENEYSKAYVKVQQQINQMNDDYQRKIRSLKAENERQISNLIDKKDKIQRQYQQLKEKQKNSYGMKSARQVQRLQSQLLNANKLIRQTRQKQVANEQLLLKIISVRSTQLQEKKAQLRQVFVQTNNISFQDEGVQTQNKKMGFINAAEQQILPFAVPKKQFQLQTQTNRLQFQKINHFNIPKRTSQSFGLQTQTNGLSFQKINHFNIPKRTSQSFGLQTENKQFSLQKAQEFHVKPTLKRQFSQQTQVKHLILQKNDNLSIKPKKKLLKLEKMGSYSVFPAQKTSFEIQTQKKNMTIGRIDDFYVVPRQKQQKNTQYEGMQHAQSINENQMMNQIQQQRMYFEADDQPLLEPLFQSYQAPPNQVQVPVQQNGAENALQLVPYRRSDIQTIGDIAAFPQQILRQRQNGKIAHRGLQKISRSRGIQGSGIRNMGRSVISRVDDPQGQNIRITQSEVIPFTQSQFNRAIVSGNNSRGIGLPAITNSQRLSQQDLDFLNGNIIQGQPLRRGSIDMSNTYNTNNGFDVMNWQVQNVYDPQRVVLADQFPRQILQISPGMQPQLRYLPQQVEKFYPPSYFADDQSRRALEIGDVGDVDNIGGGISNIRNKIQNMAMVQSVILDDQKQNPIAYQSQIQLTQNIRKYIKQFRQQLQQRTDILQNYLAQLNFLYERFSLIIGANPEWKRNYVLAVGESEQLIKAYQSELQLIKKLYRGFQNVFAAPVEDLVNSQNQSYQVQFDPRRTMFRGRSSQISINHQQPESYMSIPLSPAVANLNQNSLKRQYMFTPSPGRQIDKNAFNFSSVKKVNGIDEDSYLSVPFQNFSQQIQSGMKINIQEDKYGLEYQALNK